MNSTLNQIEQIKKYGYTLDFSNVFNHAFENYKKIALYAGLILLILFIVFCFIGGLSFVLYYGAENLNKDFFESFKDQQPSTTNLIIYTGAATLMSALFSPFAAGFLKMADSADKDEAFNVSTIFTYYRPHYFSHIFLATLLIGLTTGLISVLFNFLGIIIIDTVLSVVISLFTSLTIPLIIFGGLQVSDAIKSSIIIVSKQPFIIVLLFIVAGIASMVGFIGCCIGVVFTIPFTYSITYAIYSAILNTDQPDSIDSIGQSDFE
jgi:MFS family permease